MTRPSNTLPPVEEEKTKGRSWNGYACPGCRTVFRVAADFSCTEVMCPSCNGTLRLPKTPEEVQPHTVQTVRFPADESVKAAKPARTADLETKDQKPSALQTLLASSGGRLKLTLGLLFPMALIAGVLLVFPSGETSPDKLVEEDSPSSQPESQVAEQPAPPPPPVAVNEMPVPEEEAPPALSEVAVSEPAPAPMPESLPKPAEIDPVPEIAVTPPPTPEPPAITGEEELVAAIPAEPPTAPEKTAPVAQAETPPTPAPRPVEDAAPATKTTDLVHTVVRGDTLTNISRQYQVGIATIKNGNGLKSDVVMLGQQLKILGGTAPTAKTTPTAVAEKPAPAPAPRSHTVVRGDTLERIARKYGVSPQQIMRANAMKNDIVQLGRKLVIPAP